MFVRSGVDYRIEILKKHIENRNIYEYFDVHFFTDYPSDHPFIIWLHKFAAPHISKQELSGFVKYCEIFKLALEMNLEEFVIIDDDAVFIENWRDAFNKKCDFFDCMCMGVNYHILPSTERITIGNVGGCQCLRCTNKFAKFVLNNIDFDQAIDIVFGAIMLHHGYTLDIIPICQQTSIIDDRSEQKHNDTTYKIDWVTYTRNYKPSGISYDKIKKAYDEFMNIKKIVEDDFETRFSQKCDIWNIDYIMKRYKLLAG